LRELTASEGGPNHMMVIGEDWCGDVVRELPVLARFAEAAGLELRIFPRDENHDIMNEYLKEGLYMSIPVAVFYTKDHDYICHWIERSQAANREQGEIEAAIRTEQPDIDDQDFGRQRRARTAARAGDWQQATVDELEGMLREHLH
jgi:thiol-disulfide isomerase/thioredoxin